MLQDKWVFYQESFKVASLVDLRYKLTLSHFAALVDQKSHDSLGHHITDGLLNNLKVRVDQVLDNSGFHQESRTFLICTYSHE